jgi:aryl-alcohol dehydrogenase-like predicted oxidoreductase
MVDSLVPIAAKIGCSLPLLALAWCLKNRNVSTVILGASKPAQVTENLNALEVVPKLTADVMAEIDSVLQNVPKPNKNWGRGAGRNAP